MSRAGFEQRGDVLHFLMPPHLSEITARLYLRGPLLNGTEGRPSEIQKRLAQELGSQGLVAPMQVHGTAVFPLFPSGLCLKKRVPMPFLSEGIVPFGVAFALRTAPLFL